MNQNIILCDGNKLDIVEEIALKNNVGIELQTFYNPMRLDNVTDSQIEQIREKISRIHIKSMHGPFCDLCPGSIDSKIRDVTIYRYIQIIKIAKKLQIDNIVLHHGYYPNTTSEEKWIKNFTSTVEKILPELGNITLYFENLFETDGNLINKAIKKINEPQIKVCLDVGHVNCFSNYSIIKWFELLNNSIGYIHLHNNYGIQDSHLCLNQGTLDFVDIINFIETYCPNALCAIETNVQSLKESLDFFIKNKVRM